MLDSLAAELKASNLPKSKFIENYIIDRINEGALKKGSRLPSINELSGKCKIARETVVKSYNLLKQKGLVESRHGKGFIVIKSKYKKLANVYVLLDVMSNAYKEQLVRGINENIGGKVQITYNAHRYNPEAFVSCLENAIGRFEYYVVFAMRDKSTFKSVLKIPQNRLLLLDVPADIKDCDCSQIYQNSDLNFKKALSEALPHLKKYNKFYMIFDPQYHHPIERVAAFEEFCAENRLPCEILPAFEKSKLGKGTFWMIMTDVHLVDLLLCAKGEGLKVKSDFGVITYDDTPMKKVVADGVATISVDFYNMGRLVAEQLQNWNPELKITVPSIFTRRSTV
ncbi:MAG: GntR family transcriptional regulator [Opitutales bacterium]|nr:GntR family transcriptional regulator [Opitutales bacterium]